MPPELSIVIPAFEEEARIGGPIKTILNYVAAENLSAELIVVDDGSKDRTKETAEAAFSGFDGIPAQVIRYEQNRGKGFAVRTGLAAAKAEIALFSDADLSTPIDETSKLVELIRKGDYDVTFGSRALDRSLIGTHQPWRREQGGRVINLMIRTLSGLDYSDTQCGFKAFRMSRFRPLLESLTIDRFGFDVELLYVAKYHGLRLKEIPVRWNDVAGSKVSAIRDTRRMVSELLQIRKNSRKGHYKNERTA